MIKKPSPNFASRDGNPIKYICLHIMQGTLAGTDNWFSSTRSNTSSNYGVGYNGEVHQYVDDDKMAFANGLVNKPSAQIVKDNLNVNQNKISLSIECEGYSLANAPKRQLNALAFLINQLCKKYNLLIDRQHIIGHYEINSVTRPNCPSVDKSIIDKIIKQSKNMEKLVITNVEVKEGKTFVSYHRFSINEDGTETDKTSQTWPPFDGELTNEQVLEKAKSMVDAGIEVSYENN